MARFTNLTNSTLVLTDEDGVGFRFDPGETRTGLSNYFYTYTADGGASDPVLVLVGSLDGDGDIPGPGTHQDNRLRQPGSSQDYDDAANDGGANMRKQVVIDLANEDEGVFRRIDSRYVGLREFDVLPLKSNEDDTATNLTTASTITLTSADGPIHVNGRVATDAEAAANPAVEAGTAYTVFGVITVTDDSAAADSTLYFSVTGTDSFTFVPADDYAAAAPTAPATGNAVNTSTPTITLGVFGNTPEAADGVSVDTFFAQSPNTAAKFAAAFDLGHNADGLYFNEQENILFLVENNNVHHFAPTASATIS